MILNSTLSNRKLINIIIINIEKASSIPLVFSTHGGMGPECRTLLKRVATKIANKRGENDSSIIKELRGGLRSEKLET